MSGTSMWAMIAAAYALWKTSSEIQDFTKNINFLKLIDLGSRKWVVGGAKVMKKLEDFIWDASFENTKVPLKIIATDLIHTQTKVFSSWKILPAIRASISLPSIFEPQEIDGIKYVDGWLRQNLPVLTVESNSIIAVSAITESATELKEEKSIGSFIFKKSFFWVNYQIIKKTIATIMKTNENLSCRIATLEWKNIILLAPDVWGFEYYDFNKVEAISKLWYIEARDKISPLI